MWTRGASEKFVANVPRPPLLTSPLFSNIFHLSHGTRQPPGQHCRGRRRRGCDCSSSTCCSNHMLAILGHLCLAELKLFRNHRKEFFNATAFSGIVISWRLLTI